MVLIVKVNERTQSEYQQFDDDASGKEAFLEIVRKNRIRLGTICFSREEDVNLIETEDKNGKHLLALIDNIDDGKADEVPYENGEMLICIDSWPDEYDTSFCFTTDKRVQLVDESDIKSITDSMKLFNGYIETRTMPMNIFVSAGGRYFAVGLAKRVSEKEMFTA